MNRKEVEQFIGTNTPDMILNWLDSQATQEEGQLAKNIMRQAINMTNNPYNLMDDTVIFPAISIMGIS